jgi:flagellar hook-basal body complex protein FliE
MAIQSILSNLPSIIAKQEVTIGDVNKAQMDASKSTQSFVNGDGIEIHDVMIAGEKAKTSLQLLMEIRNKTVDMYRELTRMSI